MGRKIPEYISLEEFEKIIKVCKSSKHKTAYKLGFWQCMRVSEVVKLKKEDINLERNYIHIKQAKGKKDRHIPIKKEARQALKHIPLGIGCRALQRAINRHSKKAIGRKIYFHTLRHSGATYYHKVKEADIRDLQVFLGHSRIDTTQIYTHIEPEYLRRIFKEE